MSEHGDKAAPLDLQAHALEALNIVARVGVMQIFYFYSTLNAPQERKVQ